MSAEPESHDAKNLEWEVVTEEPPRRNPWRPTTLTVRKFLRICHLIEQGFATSRACEAECISYQRFRFRVQRSLRLQQRLKEAEDVRFNLRHEECMAIILSHAPRSWLAAAWWLERNLPARYALRNVPRPDPDESTDEAEEEIPSQVLEHHRHLMLQLAREDEQRKALEA